MPIVRMKLGNGFLREESNHPAADNSSLSRKNRSNNVPNPAGRIDAALPKVIAAEPVERKFLKTLKNSDIEALQFDAQPDEGVREGWITAEERKQLEELRAMTLDAIMVDDFDSWELRSAGYREDAPAAGGTRLAAA